LRERVRVRGIILFLYLRQKGKSMSFLKTLFNDEGTKIGLCGFKMTKPKYSKTSTEPTFYFNPFQQEKAFETNFRANVLLL